MRLISYLGILTKYFTRNRYQKKPECKNRTCYQLMCIRHNVSYGWNLLIYMALPLKQTVVANYYKSLHMFGTNADVFAEQT